MSDSNIQNVLRKAFAETMDVPPEQITDSTTFQSLGMDDLDVVELMMMVEEELQIEITEENDDFALGTGKTFAELVQVLEGMVTAQA